MDEALELIIGASEVVMRLAVIFLFLLLSALAGCSYTNCTFNLIQVGDGSTASGIRQVPIDRSTQGNVNSQHTVSPSATVPVLP